MNKLPSTAWLPGLMIILLASACSKAEHADFTGSHVESLPNGGILVRNAPAGVWSDSDHWILQEDLRIGSLDGAGPDVFGSLMSLSLAVDDDGNIFVLDGQSSQIRVFNSSGHHVRTFGGHGAGPGEMRSGYLAGWGPEGTLWVADPVGARYTAYSAEGDYIASYPRQLGFSMHPWPGMVDKAGRVLDVGIRQGTRFEHVLLRVDPRTGAADTFVLPQYEGEQFQLLNSAGLPMRSAPVPFSAQLVWRVDREGYIWSAITNQYRIVQQTLGGDTIRIIELVREPVSVTQVEREEALKNLESFVAAGGIIDASRIPSTKPFLYDFAEDDRGNVWVAAVNASGEMVYDVFDENGRYMGMLEPPTRVLFWPVRPVFRDNQVYGFSMNELGVPSLVRLRITNSGTQ